MLPLAFVLMATIFLIVGLLQDSGLALIYVSIGCSLAAGILWVLTTLRPKGRPDVLPDEPELFPIADYDALTVEQVLPLLPELYADEVEVVHDREVATKGRVEVIECLGQLRTLLRGAPADATGAGVLAAGEEPIPPVRDS